jgi:superfamily II DNA or RNA helicase
MTSREVVEERIQLWAVSSRGQYMDLPLRALEPRGVSLSVSDLLHDVQALKSYVTVGDLLAAHLRPRPSSTERFIDLFPERTWSEFLDLVERQSRLPPSVPGLRGKELIDALVAAGGKEHVEAPLWRLQLPINIQGISVLTTRELLVDSPGWLASLPAKRLDQTRREVEQSLQRLLAGLMARRELSDEGWRERLEEWDRAPVTDPIAQRLETQLRTRLVDLRRVLPNTSPERAYERVAAAWNDAEGRFDLTSPAMQRSLPMHVFAVPQAWPEGPLQTVCDCGRPDCETQVIAVEAFIDLLRKPATVATVQVLGKPAWERLLTQIDRAADAPSAVETSELRLVWLVEFADKGQAHLSLCEQRLLKRGGWSKPKPVSERDIRVDIPPGQMSAYLRLIRAEQTYGDRRHQLEFEALHALAGQAGVLATTPAAAEVLEVDVVSPPLQQRFTAVEGGQSLALYWGETPVKLESVSRAALEDGYLLRLDRERQRIEISPVTPAQLGLLRGLGRVQAVFPPEARAQVLARLGSLQRVAPVALGPEWLGAPVAAKDFWVLRLAVGGGGLRVSLWVRPLDGGPPVAPGEGDPLLWSQEPDGSVRHVIRERDLEKVAARARWAGLGLPDADDRREAVLEGDAALGFVARLEEAADPTLAIEWTHDRWKMGKTATLKGLKLQVKKQRDWFGLEGSLQSDLGPIPLAQVLLALKDQRRFVEVAPGQFAQLSDEVMQAVANAAPAVWKAKNGLEVSAAAAPALDALLEAAGETSIDASFEKLRQNVKLASTKAYKVPAGLKAELRDYQVEGFKWMARLAGWGMGGVLADDMGLGKTVQAIAMLLHRAGEGPALVVAPTSVVFNWERELARFAPSLKPYSYRGEDREALIEGASAGQVVLVSWGLLAQDADKLAKRKWGTVIFDEAQAMKNAETQRAKAAAGLKAGWTLALTGTPVENHLGELWSLFRVAVPGLLGSWEQFRERFATPIEISRSAIARALLARLVTPFILRRTKAVVAPELPPRTDVTRWVTLSKAERAFYEAVRQASLQELEEETLETQAGQGRFRVLAAITRLRQAACHPLLVEGPKKLGSAKLDALVEIVESLKEEGNKVLVFSQFTRLLALSEERLREAGASILTLDGSTSPPERQRRVDAFQRGEADVFLLSLKAGGTGLNLTAAGYVVHLDPWWNPAVEDQATDRAHRIGQDKPVTVYRLVSKGTIEEEILALHADKRELVEALLEGSERAGTLSPKQLLGLIRSGADVADIADDGEAAEARPAAKITLDASPVAPKPKPPERPLDAPQTLQTWTDAGLAALVAAVKAGKFPKNTASAYRRQLIQFAQGQDASVMLTRAQLQSQAAAVADEKVRTALEWMWR